MPELQIDLAVANRFISSLSKSLQALCHGCMDFDSGIEIVGYININIDSGSKVDYVLNEKVLKSTTNSMTFVSNSFLAKKEQPKQTRDGACSPIPQPQQITPYTPRMPPAYLNSRFQKGGAQLSPYSHNQKGPQKRTRADDLKLQSHKKYLQSHSADSPAAVQTAHSHLPPVSAGSSYSDLHSQQSDNGASVSTQRVNIKTETLEADSQNNFDKENLRNPSDDQNLDSSLDQTDKVQVKCDPDETNSGRENTYSNNDSDNPVTNESEDFKSNFLEPSLNDNQQPTKESCSQLESDSQCSLGVGSDVGGKEHSLLDEVNMPSTSKDNAGETDVDMSAENEPASSVSVDYDKSVDDGSYYQPGYDDAGEGSNDAGQFEVIEIDDEDEDVQAMFGDHRHTPRQSHEVSYLSPSYSGPIHKGESRKDRVTMSQSVSLSDNFITRLDSKLVARNIANAGHATGSLPRRHCRLVAENIVNAGHATGSLPSRHCRLVAENIANAGHATGSVPSRHCRLVAENIAKAGHATGSLPSRHCRLVAENIANAGHATGSLQGHHCQATQTAHGGGSHGPNCTVCGKDGLSNTSIYIIKPI